LLRSHTSTLIRTPPEVAVTANKVNTAEPVTDPLRCSSPNSSRWRHIVDDVAMVLGGMAGGIWASRCGTPSSSRPARGLGTHRSGSWGAWRAGGSTVMEPSMWATGRTRGRRAPSCWPRRPGSPPSPRCRR